MYVSPISSRFCVGRLTPAIRAMRLLPLPLLVPGVGADHDRAAVPLDDAAALAHGLDGWTDLHRSSLLHPKGDSAAGEVIGRELDLDAIAGEDADVVLAHLPGDAGEDGMAVVELDPEHRRRKRLDDLAFDLDLLFLDCHFAREQTFRLGISCENSGTNGRPRRGGTS